MNSFLRGKLFAQLGFKVGFPYYEINCKSSFVKSLSSWARLGLTIDLNKSYTLIPFTYNCLGKGVLVIPIQWDWGKFI